jgi:hypothetical protein
MLRKPSPQQTALEMVSLDGLVPKDHLLRKIDAVIDFSFWCAWDLRAVVGGRSRLPHGGPALSPPVGGPGPVFNPQWPNLIFAVGLI